MSQLLAGQQRADNIRFLDGESIKQKFAKLNQVLQRDMSASESLADGVAEVIDFDQDAIGNPDLIETAPGLAWNATRKTIDNISVDNVIIDPSVMLNFSGDAGNGSRTTILDFVDALDVASELVRNSHSAADSGVTPIPLKYRAVELAPGEGVRVRALSSTTLGAARQVDAGSWFECKVQIVGAVVDLSEYRKLLDAQASDVTYLVGNVGLSVGHRVTLTAYHPGWAALAENPRGGGSYVWKPALAKTAHNGGTIISPTVPWDGSPGATHADFLNGVGETDGAGSGCWSRVYTELDIDMFGVVGDDTVEDQPAMQAAADESGRKGESLNYTGGTFRVTQPVIITGANTYLNRNYTKFKGQGAGTIIHAIGCAAFTMPDRGYYRFSISHMALEGNDAAGIPAIDMSPAAVTNIVGGARFHDMRVLRFKTAFKMKNAQINYFNDLDIDFTSPGQVFEVVPDSGSGQQCNANRVHRMRCTGDGTMIKATLPTVTERVTAWKFRECDIQFSGTQIPFHIIDSYYSIIDCEFENSAATHLIHLEATGANLTPQNTEVKGNILLGAAVAIRSSKAAGAAQTPTSCQFENNITGSGNFFDLEAGNDFKIGYHAGTVNNTGGRFTHYESGKAKLGQVHLVNRAGANDAVGAVVGAISSTGVLGKNLAGTATFPAATSVTVLFGARAEPDADYRVAISGSENNTFWVTSKTATGFVIVAASSTSATVDWHILR